jgi:hypothetical protein
VFAVAFAFASLLVIIPEGDLLLSLTLSKKSLQSKEASLQRVLLKHPFRVFPVQIRHKILSSPKIAKTQANPAQSCGV